MFKRRDIVTAIEIATSKICVLVGACGDDEPMEVIGQSEVPVDGEVVKGEITDMDKVLEKFCEALEIADISSNNEQNNSVFRVMSVSACNISSRQDSAASFVKGGKISTEEIHEAETVIEQRQLPNNLEKINIIDSYYLLDGVRRVRNPLEQNAHKLELFSHVICGDANRLNNFRSTYFDAGFEDPPEMIFSALADLYGVVSQEEREHGVLLVDMGKGTTEYLGAFNGGVFASGVIPVGFDHVANDLSVGLSLPISVCRTLLTDNTLQRHAATAMGIIEINLGTSIRRIPLSSFEKIIDLRLREIFTIVKSNFFDLNMLRNLACGGVLTGGGALFPRSAEIFHTIFEFPVRVGHPYEHDRDIGALADPRYSTLWGALKYAESQLNVVNAGRKRGLMTGLTDGFGKLGDSAWRIMSGLKHSIKI